MATATNTIRQRVRAGVVAALKGLELTGFAADNIVTRKTPLAKGLGSPCIVVSPARARRRPAPAGLRYVIFPVVVSIYFLGDGSGEPDADAQDNVVDTIEAKFQLPPQMPAELVAAVPEAHELRVADSAEQYLPAAFRYNVDAHRLAIEVECCLLAGVAA